MHHLDEILTSKCRMDKVLTKTSKGTAVIKRLGKFVPRKSLITIYKAFIRRHVGYAYTL